MEYYQDFLKNENYIDLKIKGLHKDGGISHIATHKIIMAATFGEEFVKFVSKPTNYLPARKSTLEAMVAFAYNFPVNVSNENLSELLKFSSSYQDFAKIIDDYLLKNITLNNALETFQLAHEGIPHERERLQTLQLIKAFIVKKCLPLNDIKGGFRNLPLPIMEEFVKDR